ncbi:hypothetical protein V1512DRAFT_227822 [Lipomyces arxii]|uniref:uncharacterized protein n=1 Tax=Lipomyces arxii TaxID=56418 RepID=UPI0034CFF015
MALPPYEFAHEIRRVGVIGAGASGLAAVKALIGEKKFKIKVFERNGISGGLWNYSDDVDDQVAMPSVDPGVSMKPVVKDGKQVWTSAAYDKLFTNVPTEIMTFENKGYVTDASYFATRGDIADFLHAYSREIDGLIAYNTNVTDVRKVDGEWVVSTDDGVEKFDAVVVASGYFNLPYVPDVKGLREYAEKYPGSIVHSKAFRRADSYLNKTVLVIGNAASGIDISNLLVDEGIDVYQSVRSETIAPGKPNPGIKIVGEVDHFDSQDKTIHCKDGTVLSVDVVIYATGYLRSLPFMRDINESEKRLITNGMFVNHLYLNFIYYDDPTLVLLGTPRFVLPFRVSQAQACLIARVWSGRLKLPPKRVMELYYTKRLYEVGQSKEFHDLKYPADADFCEYVRALCQLCGGDYGVVPRKWTRAERTLRKNIGELKVGFSEHFAATGTYARTADELVRSGSVSPLEIDTAEPEFEMFGPVKNGDEFTSEDVHSLEEEISRIPVQLSKVATSDFMGSVYNK